jgi:hypothetical protein
MSSSVNILAPTEMLSNNIYFDAYAEDKVRITCNACSFSPPTFFEGDDWSHLDVDWLGTAINHLIEVHPELFKTT